MKLSSFFLGFNLLSLALATGHEAEPSVENKCQCPSSPQRFTRRHSLEDVSCRRRSMGLARRADGDDDDGGIGVGVNLPSVGLSLGNISTKLGNINLTVTNVTIALGSVDVENVAIGNISVIVSVPLPGASPVQAFSALSSSTSIASSTATPTSTVSSGTSVTQTATSTSGFFQRIVRQENDDETTSAAQTSGGLSTISLPDPTATATVSGGPINLGTGSVDTEIGNITIFVGNVNVSVGDIKIKNITVGNIFVLVQIGQPDLTGALSNLTNTLNGITNQ